jgi:multidrug resistance efflux pump
MRIDIFIHEASRESGLDSLHQKVDTIMATQAEQAAKLRALGAQLAKARGEIIAAVDRLTAAVAAGGGTTPEVDDATAALQVAVQGLDDLNPDETPEEPPATP